MGVGLRSEVGVAVRASWGNINSNLEQYGCRDQMARVAMATVAKGK